MELFIPEQKFTLSEGGWGNIKIEVLPAQVVADEPTTPEPAPAATTEEAVTVTTTESEQPAQTTEPVTVDGASEVPAV